MTLATLLLVQVMLAAAPVLATVGATRKTMTPQADTAVSKRPDYPLDAVPTTPVSPRFVVEHRSALNGRTVTIRGTVVRVVSPEDLDSPPAGGVTPSPGAYPQPRIFLSDSPAQAADATEVMVRLREGDRSYQVGQLIEVEGIVEASRVALTVRRVYPAK